MNAPSETSIRCPNCGRDDLCAHGKRHALYPYGLVAIFSLLLASMHYAYLPYEYTCRHCGRRFRHRPRSAVICVWILLIVLAMVILAGVVVISLIAGL